MQGLFLRRSGRERWQLSLKHRRAECRAQEEGAAQCRFLWSGQVSTGGRPGEEEREMAGMQEGLRGTHRAASSYGSSLSLEAISCAMNHPRFSPNVSLADPEPCPQQSHRT